jgi:hypothetical protein
MRTFGRPLIACACTESATFLTIVILTLCLLIPTWAKSSPNDKPIFAARSQISVALQRMWLAEDHQPLKETNCKLSFHYSAFWKGCLQFPNLLAIQYTGTGGCLPLLQLLMDFSCSTVERDQRGQRKVRRIPP